MTASDVIAAWLLATMVNAKASEPETRRLAVVAADSLVQTLSDRGFSIMSGVTTDLRGDDREAEKQALHEQVQLVLAGHSLEASEYAAAAALAICVGYAAHSFTEADDLINRIAAEMKEFVRSEWQGIKAAEASVAMPTNLKAVQQ